MKKTFTPPTTTEIELSAEAGMCVTASVEGFSSSDIDYGMFGN